MMCRSKDKGDTTRRRFLQQAAAGGAVALGWDLVSQAQSPDTPEPTMCIARWQGALDPAPEAGAITSMAERLTEQAIAELGGMSRFVKRGDVVWIKPNMGSLLGPEFAVNTNPDVVATLARLCLDAGAKQVKVGDHAAYGAVRTYPISGIEAAAKAVGAEVVYLKDENFKEMALNGERLKVWPLYPEIIEADLVINVPIVKQHGLARVTACMKNYMGVAGNPRYQWHQDLPRCLSDLTFFMKPRLSVVDAVRVLMRNGPSGGELSDVSLKGIVAAGTNTVGLEAFSAELIGLDPKEGRTMALAEAKGLGRVDYRSLPMKEVEVSG